MSQTYDDKRRYMREYMRDYRNGERRKIYRDDTREAIKRDRLAGVDIYTIGLRYGYNPCSIARICQHLPIEKHVNRGKRGP